MKLINKACTANGLEYDNIKNTTGPTTTWRTFSLMHQL